MAFYQIPHPNGQLLVFDESASHKEIDICWTSNEGKVEICLKALWQISTSPLVQTTDPFQVGDYFQHTILAEPTQKRLGPCLLNFIAANKSNLAFPINNFYSTQLTGDATGVSVHAKKMWDTMVEQNTAIFHPELQRYQLLWQENP